MNRIWYESIIDQAEKSDKIFSRGRPFFLYNPSVAVENILAIRTAWSGSSKASTKVFFSVKANPNPGILKELESVVDGYDVSSEMEFDLLVRLGIGGKRITLSGPAKTDRLLKKALEQGVYGIHFDSEEEYFAYKRLKENDLSQSQSRLTMRLAHGKIGSHKLGFSDENLGGILKKINDQSCFGFHIYLGRESFSAPVVRSVIEKATEFRQRFPIAFHREFELFLGAGFPSANCGLIEDLRLVSADLQAPFPVHLETGRYIMNTAGIYGTRILAVKVRPKGKAFVIINGGLQHLAANLVSPRYGRRHLRCLLKVDRPGGLMGGESREYDIYGSLGIWNDCILPEVSLPQSVERGDWLIFFPTGAYGYTAAANQFIGPPRIDEWMVGGGGENFELKEVSAPHLVPYQLAFSNLERSSCELLP